MPARKKAQAAPGLPWTKAQRAALSGSRRPHRLDPPLPPRTREEAWAAIVRIARDLDAKSGPVRVVGGSPWSVPVEAANALFEPVRASVETGEAPQILDFATEQIRAAALVRADDPNPGPDDAATALLVFWIETAGFGWLFRLARAPFLYPIHTRRGSGRMFGEGNILVSDSNRHWGLLAYAPYLDSLRRILFSLPEAEYGPARDALLAGLEASLPAGDRANPAAEDLWLAYVLGREGDRGNRLFGSPDGDIGLRIDAGMALASLTDAGVFEACALRYPLLTCGIGSARAFDVVETFQGRAGPVYRRALDAVLQRNLPIQPLQKRRVDAAIALAESPIS